MMRPCGGEERIERLIVHGWANPVIEFSKRVCRHDKERVIQELVQGFREALDLIIGGIIGGNSQLAEIVLLSLRVSGIALAISTDRRHSARRGAGAGAVLCWRRLSVALVYTGMAFPPVVIGLFVYLLLSRSGVLGGLGLPGCPSSLRPKR